MFIGAFNREITSCFFSKPYIRISLDGRILNSAHFLSSLSLFFVHSPSSYDPRKGFSLSPGSLLSFSSLGKLTNVGFQRRVKYSVFSTESYKLIFPQQKVWVFLINNCQLAKACPAEPLFCCILWKLKWLETLQQVSNLASTLHYTSNFTPFEHLSVSLARFNASKVLNYGPFAIWLGKTYKSWSWQPRWWWKTAPV